MKNPADAPSAGTAKTTTTLWHRLEASAAAALLESDLTRGLGQAEAIGRHARFGVNALVERGGRSPWRLLWDQLASTLVVVLLIAAAVSAVVGSLKDAIAILAIVLLNAALGLSRSTAPSGRWLPCVSWRSPASRQSGKSRRPCSTASTGWAGCWPWPR